MAADTPSAQSKRRFRPLWSLKAHFYMPSAEAPMFGEDRRYPIGPTMDEVELMRRLLGDHIRWADRYGRDGRIARTAAAAESLLAKIEHAVENGRP